MVTRLVAMFALLAMTLCLTGGTSQAQEPAPAPAVSPAELEKRVADLEARIELLERERDDTFRLLSDASASGNATAIADLSKKSRDVGPKIDAAYAELEAATKDLERETRTFEKDL